MDSCYLRSVTGTPILTSLPKNGFLEKPLVHGQVLHFQFLLSKSNPRPRNLQFAQSRARGSVSQGTAKFSSFKVEALSKAATDAKDDNLVFVAGATGRVGSRTVRELLKLGFQVKAGVRSSQKAGSLVQSVKEMKLNVENPSVDKLEIVECDLEKQDQIGPAIGNASIVICCIGASEKEVFDVTGPYRIDYQAAKNLIDAATIASVKHFIMVSSLGTNKVGFPAAVLNLFWGVLIWKRKAEEALIASGIPFSIVRPGGMERPTDSYKETHNMTLSEEDTLFGGQVSNLQVAELMAFMAKNRGLSYCKVVEVIAETTAPLTNMEKLLAKIPSKRKPKDSDAASNFQTMPPNSGVSEVASTSHEKEPVIEKTVVKEQPLSPYAAYEDLKPPTSPTPTQSNSARVINASDKDSKPAESNTSPSLSEAYSSEPSILKEDSSVEEKKLRPLSPYYAYDDLKPPTSPIPSVPNGSLLSTLFPAGASQIDTTSRNNTSEPFNEDEPKEKQHHNEPKQRPLSPFHMYEDLKPPSSPIPLSPTSK